MDKPTPKSRPLSPHIQIYKWQWTSALSILHRLTGVTLGLLLLIFLGWIGSLALGAEVYQQFQAMIQSPMGNWALMACCFAFYFHLANGIRHLVWGTGHGYNLRVAMLSGLTVVILSVAASVLTIRGF